MRAWLSIFVVLPHFLHVPFIRTVARMWYWVIPIRRALVLENLRRAFPDRSAAWYRRTAIESLVHFTRMGLEFWPLADRERGERMVAEMVDGIEGEEHYEAVGGSDGGFLFVSGHLGHWELMMSYYAAFRGQKAAVLAKPMHNPLVEAMVARVRSTRGYEVIHTRSDMRRMLGALREGKALCFLVDQDARRQGIFVDFFGEPAATFTGPAVFAQRRNLPILVGSCTRATSDGRYRIRFFPPIRPRPDADRDEEVRRLTQAYTERLEEAISMAPDQYFWFHRRWKTKPRPSEARIP